MTSVVDHGIYSNPTWLATSNVPANANLVPASHTTLSVVKILHADTWHNFHPGHQYRSHGTNFKSLEEWFVDHSILRTHKGRTIHSTTYNSKQLCTYYYSASKDSKEWRCRKCGHLKNKNGEWTNLSSHLKLCVGKDFALQYIEHADGTRVR